VLAHRTLADAELQRTRAISQAFSQHLQNTPLQLAWTERRYPRHSAALLFRRVILRPIFPPPNSTSQLKFKSKIDPVTDEATIIVPG
jgi:hypothetical protein